jgi:hypothetical protein
MTDTTRDLIQRLVDELTNAIRVIHNEDGTHHISTAAPVLDEARAFLSQPEPEWLTEEEIEKRFQRWWFNEGSGMRPFNGEDQEEHARRVSQIAWSNGAYVARYNCPTTTTETP